ncbi:MAG: LysM peptidoglycan-binding domain-containing protein [Chitinispirillaceae bacterium]|nr:LysM peptidoglycan-binding domain-containing protein [Chitinispirillaceae bacterium]
MKIVRQCMGATLLMSISLSAQSSLSYGEYEKQLSEYQSRDQKLREEIAHEQAVILDLKNQINSIKKKISDIRKKKLGALGITAKDVEEASEAIDALHHDITTIQNRPDEQFKRDSSRIFSFRTRLASLQSNSASRLRDLAGRFSVVVELLNQCERRLTDLSASVEMAATADNVIQEKPAIDSYTVQKINDRYETLFSIAARVYGDPLQWPKIYQANKAVIDRNFRRYQKDTNPSKFVDPSDLIFPGQVLTIPR